MCHVSHLTDALLGMVALSLAVCVTARSSTGVVCFYTDAKSCLHSFPMSRQEHCSKAYQRIIMQNLQPHIKMKLLVKKSKKKKTSFKANGQNLKREYFIKCYKHETSVPDLSLSISHIVSVVSILFM